jgi:uncharacterized protein
MERRIAAELRATGGKSPRLAGYAAVFGTLSEDLGGFREKIAPGAFSRSLRSNTGDQLALVHHRPELILGRRSAGTLHLAEDQHGLSFTIEMPPTQAARDLLVSVERRDVAGASFGFSVPQGGDKWDVVGGQAIRTLVDVDLFEITITGTPAYPDTEVALRAFKARHLDNADRLRALHRWLSTC